VTILYSKDSIKKCFQKAYQHEVAAKGRPLLASSSCGKIPVACLHGVWFLCAKTRRRALERSWFRTRTLIVITGTRAVTAANLRRSSLIVLFLSHMLWFIAHTPEVQRTAHCGGQSHCSSEGCTLAVPALHFFVLAAIRQNHLVIYATYIPYTRRKFRSVHNGKGGSWDTGSDGSLLRWGLIPEFWTEPLCVFCLETTSRQRRCRTSRTIITAGASGSWQTPPRSRSWMRITTVWCNETVNCATRLISSSCSDPWATTVQRSDD